MADFYNKCNGNYGSRYNLALVVTENSTSTVNNTSSVTATLYVYADSGWGYYGSSSYGNITIDGVTCSTQYTSSAVYSDWVTVASYTRDDVPHEADGSRSISVSAWFNTDYGNLSDSYVSGTVQLTNIARYFSSTPIMTISNLQETSATIGWSTSETCKKVIVFYKTSGSNSWIEGPTIYNNNTGTTSGSGSLTGLIADTTYDLKITCTRKDSSLNSDSDSQTKATYPYPYVSAITTQNLLLPAPGGSLSQVVTIANPLGRTGITVYAKKDSTSGTQFGSVSSVSGTSATIPLTVNTMYSSIPSTTNGRIVYYCVYSSHTSSRLANGIFSTVEANCNPTVSGDPTYANTTTAHASLIGSDTIIQGQSSFSITAPTTTARGGSSINKYYFKIGSADYESATSATKTYTSTSLSANATISVYAEDSRGYKSIVKTATMRIVPYTPPYATWTTKRTGYTTNGSVTVSATRTDLKNSSNVSVNKWVGNTSSNKVSVAISPSGPSLSSNVIGTTAASFTNAGITISNLALDTSYTVTINISDKITTKTLSLKIDKAKGILSVMNDCSAVGVNIIPEATDDPGLYVDGEFHVYDNTRAQDLITAIPESVGWSSVAIDAHDVDIAGALDITGNTNITGELSATSDFSIGGTSTLNGNTTIKGNTTIGTAQSIKNLSVTGELNAGSLNSALKTIICDMIYPIGSIYISITEDTAAKVAEKFGGTWVQIKDSFLLSAGSTYTAGNTGGSSTHSHGLSSGFADITIDWDSGPNRIYQRRVTHNISANIRTENVTGFSGGDYNNWSATGLSGTTDSASNMPPYLVVYMWKRTA